MKYIVAIYPPDDHRTPIRTIEATQPFMPIHVGDLLSPSSWGEEEGPREELVAAKIKHNFSRYGEMWHQVMVFTRLPRAEERTGQ